MKYPNFLIIGAGKSGTTTIYHAMKQHPEVYMSPVKEPNFFALEGEKKVTGYDNEDPHGFHFYPWAVTNLGDYHQLFASAENEKAIGEASTMYQYMSKAPDNIKKHVPNVKIIAIFRNPADRLYSRYLHLIRESRAPTEAFEDCLDRSSLWWKKNDLIQEGFYYTHMKRYFEQFNSENIKVVLYEDLQNNPVKLLQELYEFVGVEASFEPDMSIRHNLSGKIKNSFVNQLIGQNSILRNWAGQISPKGLDKMKKMQFFQKLLFKLRALNLERKPIDNNVRNLLLKEVYQDEIEQFSALIQRDLSHWLTPKIA